MSTSRWPRTLAASAVSILVLSGCHSVINPYRKPKTPDFKTDPLQEAINYAEKSRDNYLKAIHEQTFFNRTLGTLILAAAAAATAVGITGGSTDAITGLDKTHVRATTRKRRDSEPGSRAPQSTQCISRG